MNNKNGGAWKIATNKKFGTSNKIRSLIHTAKETFTDSFSDLQNLKCFDKFLYLLCTQPVSDVTP